MPKWTTAQMPDMADKTVVVTGASRGLGLVAAREFAAASAHVVLAVRDVDRGASVAQGIPGSVEVRKLDVSDLSSVRDFAEAWRGPVDVLVNNAGVMDVPLIRTADGFDVQTATNSFGPFLLTNLLLPAITERVVWVTSQLHRRGRVQLDDLDWTLRNYRPMAAYNDSKLHVVLFSLELQRRLQESGSALRSVLAHPGIATTELAAHSPSNVINRFSFLLNDPQHGALPILFAAVEDVPGNAYVGPDGVGGVKGYPMVRRPARAGLDARMAGYLWTVVADKVRAA